MLEKVIHEDSTRYIVESLWGEMNKQKTASLYTPAPATAQGKSSAVIPSSGGSNNWYKSGWDFTVAAAVWQKKFGLFDVICKSCFRKLEKPSKALDEIDHLRSQYLGSTRHAGTLLQSRQFGLFRDLKFHEMELDGQKNCTTTQKKTH